MRTTEVRAIARLGEEAAAWERLAAATESGVLRTAALARAASIRAFVADLGAHNVALAAGYSMAIGRRKLAEQDTEPVGGQALSGGDRPSPPVPLDASVEPELERLRRLAGR